MNLSLSDEQVFLREAARGALSRFKTLEAAREALDGDESALPDLWPTACEAGWPGLLISEDHGGAGLDVFDAMLVLGECGRVIAGVPLLGHLPATAILDASSDAPMLDELATGAKRAAFLPVSPPGDVVEAWTVDPEAGVHRGDAPVLAGGKVTGSLYFVPDAPGADLLVGVAVEGGKPVGVAIEASGPGVTIEETDRYDATRSLGHVTLDGAPATVLDAPEETLAQAWHLAQSLIAAESLGSVETALDVSVAYAKERFTFGRAIGSYQAVKHSSDRGAAPARERPLAALLRGLGAQRRAGRVPARGQRGALGRGQRARRRRAHDDLGARRHRRDVGARRPAVLPPRAALAAPARRHAGATDRVAGELLTQQA